MARMGAKEKMVAQKILYPIIFSQNKILSAQPLRSKNGYTPAPDMW